MNQNPRSTRLRFDSFELDLGTGELSKNGRQIHLQDQPARLLILLTENPGTLVTRDEIKKALWQEDQFVEFDHAINTAVKKIRAALEDDIEQPRLIQTLPRKGYRFIGSVDPIAPDDPSVKRPPIGPTTHEEPKHLSEPHAAGLTSEKIDLIEADSRLMSSGVARWTFLVIQVGYLTLYSSALYYLEGSQEALDDLALPEWTFSLIIITAMCGIAIRLYLLSSVGLAHPVAGTQFHRLFPFVLFLDGLWAASPLLAGSKIGIGLALAAAAGLAYLPFSQRTLIRNIYAATAS
jgi:DNA-binding winged helix-turn-helix (wHTH) protein